MLGYSALSPGERGEFGRHNKWVSRGWAANGQRGIATTATTSPSQSAGLTNGNIGFHSSKNYFVIMDRRTRALKNIFPQHVLSDCTEKFIM